MVDERLHQLWQKINKLNKKVRQPVQNKAKKESKLYKKMFNIEN
jgi:hypothetical protein